MEYPRALISQPPPNHHIHPRGQFSTRVISRSNYATGRGQNPRPPRFQAQEAAQRRERLGSTDSSEGEGGWKEVVKGGRKVGGGRGRGEVEAGRTNFRKQESSTGYTGRRSFESRGHKQYRGQDRTSPPLQSYPNSTSPTDRHTPHIEHKRTTPPLMEPRTTMQQRLDRRSHPRVSPRTSHSPQGMNQHHNPNYQQQSQQTKSPQNRRPWENPRDQLSPSSQAELERELSIPVQADLVRWLLQSWSLTANKLRETEMVWPQKVVYYDR